MKRRAWLSWFWTLFIFVVCWLPRQYVPAEDNLPGPLVINFDKFVHAGIFAVFAIFWMRTSDSKWRGLWIFLWGIAIAAITELGQRNRIVNRDGNLADASADTIGVILGLLVYWLLGKFVWKTTGGSQVEV